MDRPRRVAVVHSILHFGSTENYLHELLERGADRVEWSLVVPDDPVLEPLRTSPAVRGRVVALPLAEYAKAPRAFLAVLRALRRLDPDVVHVADVDPPALLAARALRRPTVVTHHTPELRPAYNAFGRLLRRVAWWTKPHVVFTSEFDRATGIAREGVSPERTSVIPLAIDFDRFAERRGSGDLRRTLGLEPSQPLVGTVGLLRPQKAHEILIDAAAEVDAAFVVVGDGPRRAALEELVRARGLAHRFFLLGHRDDVPDVLAELDVFALSSDFEGMNLAVAEALAAGVPVVATAVGGVRQTVIDGETGLLVPPRDPAALAGAIRRLLEDRELARRLASAGGERVRRLYALDTMVDATLSVYERVAR